jgi:ribosomal protein S18 acetylase RimI-like enzyme
VTWMVRPMRAGDGGAMQQLHRRAIMATPDTYYSLEERRSWAFGLQPDQYVTPANGHFDVAVVDDRIVAFCDHGPDEVIGLYIDPAFQGRGIGSALLGQAEGRMRNTGTTLVKVHSALSSQAFYERHGYREVERTTHRSRGGLMLPSVRLRKQL